MGDSDRAGEGRLYATVTWSVPILVAVVPAATAVAVALWGLAGAGLVLAVVVVAALLGVRRPPGVVAGIASGVVVALGTGLVAVLLVITSGLVLP